MDKKNGPFPNKKYRETLINLLSEVQQYTKEMKDHLITAVSDVDSIDEYSNKSKSIFSDIEEKKEKFDSLVIDTLNIFETNPELFGDVRNLEDDVIKIKNLSEKVQLFYNTIYGTNSEDESGEVVTIPGQKEELEGVYNELIIKFTELESKVNESYGETIGNIKEKSSKSLKDWDDKYLLLEDKIEKLLPKAATASLATAYKEKATAEKENYKDEKWIFYVIITLMTCLGIFFVILNISEGSHIKNIILPVAVMFPLLWVGVFQNKQLKLTKKLIEEYAHKEATTTTFVGFAREVDKVTDANLSDELSRRLLSQTLDAIAKNPAECIDDHNKSDNPLMKLLSLPVWKLKELGEFNIGKIISSVHSNKDKDLNNCRSGSEKEERFESEDELEENNENAE